MGRILNMTIITGLNPLDRISGKLDFILAKNPEILKASATQVENLLIPENALWYYIFNSTY
jgi:hypothetical protein